MSGSRRTAASVHARACRLRRYGVAVTCLAAVGVCLAGGCSSGPTDELPVDLPVRIYVDRDESGMWSDGDIPLPDIAVSLDARSTAVSDQDGWARFEGVTQRRHTLSLSDQDVADLASHSIVCRSASQAVDVTTGTQIHFCFLAKGFVEIEVEEERQEG
jgi:hypothetical protein